MTRTHLEVLAKKDGAEILALLAEHPAGLIYKDVFGVIMKSHTATRLAELVETGLVRHEARLYSITAQGRTALNHTSEIIALSSLPGEVQTDAEQT